MKSPIFIFSLPRSGSTLLQRLLMSHDKISSVAEPWILLPQVYATKNQGVVSEYSSMGSYVAINEFIENLPEGRDTYIRAQRIFFLELYSKMCKEGEIYFLDKTPRYYFIIDEIVEIFPNAKFLFLFRNPVQVYSSLIKTFSNNKLFYFHMDEDVVLGTKLLSEGYEKYKEKSIAINYEDFVKNPEFQVKKIFEYLNLEIDMSVISNFNKQNTKGSKGDPTGVVNYLSISPKSLDKWKETFATFIRKKHLLSVISKIDSKSLLTQGYDKLEILEEVREINVSFFNYFLTDLKDLFKYKIIRKFSFLLFFSKTYSWAKEKMLS